MHRLDFDCEDTEIESLELGGQRVRRGQNPRRPSNPLTERSLPID